VTVCTSTAEGTRCVGEALGAALRRIVAADRVPAILALAGPLGAGKTCFVQGLARGLAVSGDVRSPTFTLIHEHPGPVPLVHVDLYRLDPPDVESLGLDEIMDAPGVTAIEWAERAAPILPAAHLRIEFRFGSGDSERCLRLIPTGTRYEQIVAAVRACGSSR
jgi:tRNA threonylcarbamoyladenosine biosynthesis protein TsaE